MSFLKAELKLPEGSLFFFLPMEFNDMEMVDALKHIRVGDRVRWERKWREMEVVVTKEESHTFVGKMKYIIIHDSDDKENRKYMILFPKSINHDFMFESMQNAAFECRFPDDILPLNCFSAGFYEGGSCGGLSETLNVKSHPTDTALFKKTFKGE